MPEFTAQSSHLKFPRMTRKKWIYSMRICTNWTLFTCALMLLHWNVLQTETTGIRRMFMVNSPNWPSSSLDVILPSRWCTVGDCGVITHRVQYVKKIRGGLIWNIFNYENNSKVGSYTMKSVSIFIINSCCECKLYNFYFWISTKQVKINCLCKNMISYISFTVLCKGLELLSHISLDFAKKWEMSDLLKCANKYRNAVYKDETEFV